MSHSCTQGEVQRSKLSNAAFIKWIRTRFKNQSRKNHHYLYFPQQLIQQMSIEKIFVEFDADGSGGLSRDEVFDMFNNFGIKITMEDLDELYDSVEVNLEELNCDMFKKCALSQQSNRVFRKIVGKLGTGYYPHNFTNMIIYIVFLSKREELRKLLTKDTQRIDSKVQKMESLLKLNDLALNNERLTNHMGLYRHNLKMELRDIWEQVNENYGQCFPFCQKLEEEFYQFCVKQLNAKSHENKSKAKK